MRHVNTHEHLRSGAEGSASDEAQASRGGSAGSAALTARCICGADAKGAI